MHHILLCDDEIHILRAAEFKLQRGGYEVRIATDGEEGWEAIRASKPELLITDCQMPRLDGLGLAKRLREHTEYRDLPIFLLTGKGFELDSKELAATLGITRLIAKPFSPREVLQWVNEVFAAPASAPVATDAAPHTTIGSLVS